MAAEPVAGLQQIAEAALGQTALHLSGSQEPRAAECHAARIRPVDHAKTRVVKRRLWPMGSRWYWRLRDEAEQPRNWSETTRLRMELARAKAAPLPSCACWVRQVFRGVTILIRRFVCNLGA